jgi:hypothetical protein
LAEKATHGKLDVDAFCGCQSQLAHFLRDPFGWHHAADQRGQLTPVDLAKLLNTLKSLCSGTNFVYSKAAGKSTGRAKHLAAGLWWLLQAAQPIADGTIQNTNDSRLARRDALRNAVKELEKLFPSAQHTEKQPEAKSGESPELAEVFRVAGLPRGPWANEIAWRILEDWGSLDRKPGPQQVPEIFTPVMAAENGATGAILWLKVRLFQIDPPGSVVGQLIPDLRRMALTEIHEDCLQAFQEVWNLTQLGRWMTGVWSLGEKAPEDFSKANQRISDASSTFTPQIGGNSAQAAMLIALLAATGAPDTYEPTDFTRPNFCLEPLSLQTAISAAVDVQGSADSKPSVSSIRGRLLQPVGKLPDKAEAAYKEGLDTIVICESQSVDDAPDLKEALAKTNEARKPVSAAGDYRGLWVEHAKTVDDALQILLQSNKYLRAYQANVKQQWKSNWLPDSPSDNAEKAATPVE